MGKIMETITYKEYLEYLLENATEKTEIKKLKAKIKEIEDRNKVYLVLYDTEKEREFRKGFDTEFERDKFIRKLKYSKKIQLVRKEEC